ncbi:MAG TPA: pyruvate:ferredoxin (flavodoxin) oxidoreductase [Pyrinomonadaceae bacterium]|jgi:pyruvate-ferredoxin/flavodoxin oxidoreductase|nr:pyruvate:ferredoxin (flavodoxin) oxidoreductase [Pyrinomonadaceae bacterium]
MTNRMVTIDGNEAAAYIAYKTNEVIAIYPITPSSNMGESSDEWAAKGKKNIWGMTPLVRELQSEGGAAGTVHGSLQTGALTTTFTASQGLLLMIPNMFKIAGEQTSTVFHIAARSVATHALSIFGDHSDVMATRSTGWGMLFSNSIQEVMDFALIAQAVALESRVPFIHAFDGFRTSHEVMKIEELNDDQIRAMIDEELVRAHRRRALTPDHPVMRGTAQNPDVFFQSRERANSFYAATPEIVQRVMNKFGEVAGRQYRLFDYVGAPDAERVIVMMGSGCEAAEETVKALMARGEKVGLLKVRLYRPFSVEHFAAALPSTVKTIAVLDRTKEPGAAGEPLYQDVVTAWHEVCQQPAPDREDGQPPVARVRASVTPAVIGGRYGLGSKEFTPAMVKSVFDEMTKADPKNHFSVGIIDDVTHHSLPFDPNFTTEAADQVRALFWGLGADGTVSANKNSIKIIGEETPNYAQGYFVYDSKKSGAMTVSHLRFGPEPIHSTYLVQRANFIAVHQFNFLERYDVLDAAQPGATLLLNSPYEANEVWEHLPRSVQESIIAKQIKVYSINAYEVAKQNQLGNRTNTIMQTCFFAISGVLPRDEAIVKIKESIKKTYGKRGEPVVRQNFAAVDAALEHLHEIAVPADATSTFEIPPAVSALAPEFVQHVTAEIIAGRGDDLPVSAFPVDGTYPVGTAQWEKRNIAQEVPVWEPDICIECGKCMLVCPHATIRAKVCKQDDLANAPAGFKTMPAKWRELPDHLYTIQVAVEDCTGCQLCVEVCPAKDKSNVSRKALNMKPQLPLRDSERVNWDYFLTLPEVQRNGVLTFKNIKDIQLLQPLFEFSGACSGCGETPYIKLMTQLFGDRAVIANATGCSSIYGGNLPTTPYTINPEGRGPAWSNSLFEDNAEFGLGMRMSFDHQRAYATDLVGRFRESLGNELADGLLNANQDTQEGINAARELVAQLKAKLGTLASSELHAGGVRTGAEARDLLSVADALVKKSVWIVGGDGWAYDIGYGGLDHVLASGQNVNVLVLDTEVYSNTGGQASKATPLGAVAKFAAGGKPTIKKDLGMTAMRYGNVYIAQIAMGANDVQTVKAFLEAEAHPGPSLIIAYSQCIAHGIDMAKGMTQQKLAVESGYWPLYRFNPALEVEGKNPFQLDSKDPKIPLQDYIYTEGRYRMLQRSDPESAKVLLQQAQAAVNHHWQQYKKLATSAT